MKRTREEICQSLAQDLLDYLELMAQPAPAPDDTKLYTSAELMKMFSKSRGTISQWIREGLFGDPVKVGNSIMVTQAGVDKFIADHSGPTKKRSRKPRTRTNHAVTAHQGPPLGI